MNRNISSVFVVAFCVLLAGASADESPEDKRTRVSKEKGITEKEYDSAVLNFGSFSNYEEAQKLHLSAPEFKIGGAVLTIPNL